MEVPEVKFNQAFNDLDNNPDFKELMSAFNQGAPFSSMS
jgi:hypothetical protein